MRVLVHLNHGVDRSYMLNFGESVTKKDVAEILGSDEDDVAEALLGYAATKSAFKIEVPVQDRKKAEFEADFTVSQHGYSTERLA